MAVGNQATEEGERPQPTESRATRVNRMKRQRLLIVSIIDATRKVEESGKGHGVAAMLPPESQ